MQFSTRLFTTMTCAATRRVLWALNVSKMHLRSGLPQTLYMVERGLALFAETPPSFGLRPQISAHRAYGVPSLPYLTFGVGRLLHLTSTEAVSVRPNAQPRPDVTKGHSNRL